MEEGERRWRRGRGDGGGGGRRGEGNHTSAVYLSQEEESAEIGAKDHSALQVLHGPVIKLLQPSRLCQLGGEGHWEFSQATHSPLAKVGVDPRGKLGGCLLDCIGEGIAQLSHSPTHCVLLWWCVLWCVVWWGERLARFLPKISRASKIPTNYAILAAFFARFKRESTRHGLARTELSPLLVRKFTRTEKGETQEYILGSSSLIPFTPSRHIPWAQPWEK
jgi:hypothetical protein